MESNKSHSTDNSAENPARRLLTLDEIVEECSKETTLDLNFVGFDEETDHLLYELVTLQPDGSTKSEIFFTDENMDDIGFAVYEGYGEMILWEEITMINKKAAETERNKAVMKLREIMAKFNLALRRSVLEKYEALSNDEATDIKIFKFDFENGKGEEADLNAPVPVDSLEYFWIEYTIYDDETHDDKRMKFAFFFKDIDINKDRLNVHIVPGIFEKFVLKKEKDISEIPQAFFDEKIGKVVINNFKGDYLKEYYPFFAEQDINGDWWCPSDKYKSVPLKPVKEGRFYPVDEAAIETIPNFRDIFEEFARCELDAAKELADKLCDELNEKLGNEGARTERYTPVCWYYISGKKDVSVFLSKPIFFKGYGFFTQYCCIDLGNPGKKVAKTTMKGKAITQIDVTTNYPFVKGAANYQEVKALTLSEELDERKLKKLKENFKEFINKN